MLNFLPAILSLGASLLGKSAQKSAEGRVAEAGVNQSQDMLRNQQYNTQQNAQFNQANLDLQRKNFEENSRGGRAKQALIASLLGNMQDAKLNVPGVEGGAMGGLRVSSLGDVGKQSAGLLAQQALMKQMEGDTYQGGDILTPPELTPLPKQSMWEKIAGIGSIGMGLAGGIGQIMQGNGLTSTAAPKLPVPVKTGLNGLQLPGGLDPSGLALPEPASYNPNPELLKRVRF